jgi:hypothetical protein
VTDSETSNSDTDIIFQKVDDEISIPPEYSESFDISDAATWSDHIDDDTRCAIVRHGPVQIKLTLISPSLTTKNLRERVSNKITTS